MLVICVNIQIGKGSQKIRKSVCLMAYSDRQNIPSGNLMIVNEETVLVHPAPQPYGLRQDILRKDRLLQDQIFELTRSNEGPT